MSRSGYVDDDCYDQWSNIMWRGSVASAIRGKRGQQFLRELIAALDAMEVQQLASHQLVVEIPFVGTTACAMGAVAIKRGVSTKGVDPEDYDRVAEVMGIAPALAREIAFLNDEAEWFNDTPELRWQRMRAWAVSCLRPSPDTAISRVTP